ncbi:MAG: hypothetical protein NZ750_02590 [Anaerolineae bacterium]|nr:hypothetical protein [Anaerolineae bacterium]MDW8173433.1 hypothetical protein [Anaerolineae bacterium]
MNQLVRLWRAFWQALRLTLRGQTISAPPSPHPQLSAWAAEGQRLVEACQRLADAQGLSREKRRSLIVQVDRRPISLETVLSGLHYHFRMEYPSLILSDDEFSILTVSALNLDDVHRLKVLLQADFLQSSPLLPFLQRILAHCEALPQLSAEEATL